MTYFDSGDTDNFVVDSRALLKALLNPDAAEVDGLDASQLASPKPAVRQAHEKKSRARFWRGSSPRETGTRCAPVKSTIHTRNASR
jgi:hypothetical protein